MITDAQVNAALAAHYPGEWPDDPIFHKPIEAHTTGPYAGKPWRVQCMDEMRRVLEAAEAVAPVCGKDFVCPRSAAIVAAGISALDFAWEAVNALGGRANNSYDQGFVDAIGKALEEIEKLGGSDPLAKRSVAAAGAT